jgi:AraC-like DNA-binding protein
MLVEKAFKDPKLNIAGLSKIINTKPHILSRVLNEQFNKNFRDYINEYRIKEFIELASSEKYKNYTLLALSYEVGFNSKSTFNLAFKKVTGLSPRNFLKNSEINMDD